MTVTIGRRELLAAFGGAAAAWPLPRAGNKIEVRNTVPGPQTTMAAMF
jgi:hypothetical protein